nr:MAG TPA: hypothetical protein [Caudoviricetes sp.]
MRQHITEYNFILYKLKFNRPYRENIFVTFY